MRTRTVVALLLAVGLVAVLAGSTAAEGPKAQALLGTAFTYQGQLKQAGAPVNGTCDFLFELYNAEVGGNFLVGVSTVPVSVSNGLFTVELDFGNDAFVGEARWLKIAVRCPAGSGSHTWLTPRQRVSPAPYALAIPGLWTQQNATSPNLIGGYSGNTVSPGVVGAVIGGGGSYAIANAVTDNFGTVGGGINNWAGDNVGTAVDSSYATVGGGMNNRASGLNATVGGGYSNEASGEYSAIVGGALNSARGDEATVGGGAGNSAGGWEATVGGGTGNDASGARATIGGGFYNIASNNAATVPGGASNTASGAYSFAAGAQAYATHEGSFVWSSSDRTDSWGDQTFSARAHGGARFYSAAGTSTGVQLASGGSAWGSISDRNAKESLVSVDTGRVLETLAAMPIQTWNLKSQPAGMRHIGPVAQDFNGSFAYLFNEVESPLHINNMDAIGISLAAAQGLYERSRAQEAQIAELKAENAALEERLAALEALVAKLAEGR